MDPKLISETLFGTPWQRATLTLTSGEAIVLKHVDTVFMPPSRAWLMLVTRKDGAEIPRLIAPDHVVSIETKPIKIRKSA